MAGTTGFCHPSFIVDVCRAIAGKQPDRRAKLRFTDYRRPKQVFILLNLG
tara:strand:- start:13 stop:162 length:150 start_codon:yes stop_codon:yes gene_type:complete